MVKKNYKRRDKKKYSIPKLEVFSYIVLFATILITFLLFDYAYKYTVKPLVISELPIIKKSGVPEVITPKDKGGIVVENKDKLIFQKDSPEKGTEQSVFDAVSVAKKETPFGILKN